MKKRLLFFYEHSTVTALSFQNDTCSNAGFQDFPLHRQGLLYNIDGGIDKVPVPVVPQLNDPVATTPDYVYSEYWIKRTFNVLSTDRAVFDISPERRFEYFNGQGRLSYFNVYTEPQGIPSSQQRSPNHSIQRLIHSGEPPRGNVLITKHCGSDESLVDIDVWDRIVTNDIIRR